MWGISGMIYKGKVKYSCLL